MRCGQHTPSCRCCGPPLLIVLLVDKMQRKLIPVRAHFVTDATFPRVSGAVQRWVQKEHATLEKHHVTVLAFKDGTLIDIVVDDIVQTWKAGNRRRVLHGLVMGLLHYVGNGRKLRSRPMLLLLVLLLLEVERKLLLQRLRLLLRQLMLNCGAYESCTDRGGGVGRRWGHEV